MLAANNLSDLTNKATARTNLVLGNVDNTADANKPVSTAQAAADATKLDKAAANITGTLGLPIFTPPQLLADQNDYNPPGFSAATYVRVYGDAARSISGIAGGYEGRVLVLSSAGSFSITLLDQSALSLAANRFYFIGAPVVLLPGQSLELIYETGVWRVIGAKPIPSPSGQQGKALMSRDPGPGWVADSVQIADVPGLSAQLAGATSTALAIAFAVAL